MLTGFLIKTQGGRGAKNSMMAVKNHARLGPQTPFYKQVLLTIILFILSNQSIVILNHELN